MQRIHSDDSAIESQIQAKGKTAPRITPADIDTAIASEHYFTAFSGATAAGSVHVCGNMTKGTSISHDQLEHLKLLTFCVLVLKNGFTVTGESACASPENFDAEIGRNVARQNAVQKIWPLLGYQLKDRLSNAQPPANNAFVAPGCEQFPEEVPHHPV